MNRFARLFAVAVAFLAPAAATIGAPEAQAQPQAGAYALDDAHTSVSFNVRHLGVSNVPGFFNKVSGKASYDGKDTKTVAVDVQIDAASIDTRHAKRDDHLRSADFFDVAKFPSLTFKSKSATSAQAGKFRVTGDLTMHGVTKEVTLDVEGPTAEAKDPYGKTHVGAHATLKVNRKDFGVGPSIPGMVVSEDVGISLDIELAK